MYTFWCGVCSVCVCAAAWLSQRYAHFYSCVPRTNLDHTEHTHIILSHTTQWATENQCFSCFYKCRRTTPVIHSHNERNQKKKDTGNERRWRMKRKSSAACLWSGYYFLFPDSPRLSPYSFDFFFCLGSFQFLMYYGIREKKRGKVKGDEGAHMLIWGVISKQKGNTIQYKHVLTCVQPCVCVCQWLGQMWWTDVGLTRTLLLCKEQHVLKCQWRTDQHYPVWYKHVCIALHTCVTM